MNKLLIFVQLGSPKSTKPSDIRSFLKEFLSDPRVVDLPRLLWLPILFLFILPFRPKKISENYKRIWTDNGNPFLINTQKFYEKIKKHIQRDNVEVDLKYILGENSLKSSLQNINSNQSSNYSDILIVPLFPQYSSATTASVEDIVSEFKSQSWTKKIRILKHFYESRAFIENSARLIQKEIDDYSKETNDQYDALVISFHGLPKKRILEKCDPYWRQCKKTALGIVSKLGIDQENIFVSFQSQFGRDEWLEPSTENTVIKLAQEGKEKFLVYCPSFTCDCLETLDEIGVELKEEAIKNGAKDLTLVPCLNDDKSWIEEFSSYLNEKINLSSSSKVIDFNSIDSRVEVKKPEWKSPPLSNEAKGTLKVVLLSLLIDLIGFSIMFPMFPAMAEYYIQVNPNDVCLMWVERLMSSIATLGGVGEHIPIVLFGGILGGVYSFLQFIFAPIWGRLSDRIGRKPILLISIFFLTLSYLMWGFAGSFTLLFISRILGGVMSGNISTASAVVADITTEKNRSKGMALLGMTFGLGFILGPALGGIFSLLDLTKLFPALSNLGINPFSSPAFLAFGLCLFNLFLVQYRFKETLKPENKNKSSHKRVINPLALLKPLPFKGVNLVNLSYFLFLLAYGGMEFTLTFYAVEMFGFTSMQNAYLFIFAGFVIALVQGGYVRRKAFLIGEKKMALRGFIFLIPGFLLLGFSKSVFMLYASLLLISIGGASVIPSLTSLVSLLTPAQSQGETMGVFRSLGALARVFGPLVACLTYWHIGPKSLYVLGAFFIIFPILVLKPVSHR